MIYADSSVLLAQLLDEDRAPPPQFWQAGLVSSRLAEYEVWTRLHRARLAPAYGREARNLLERLTLVDLLPSTLARAIEPFPVPLRTLGALHLATLIYLREEGYSLALASYDLRLIAAARTLDIETSDL